MPVQVDSSRMQRRLRGLRRALPVMAAAGLVDAVKETSDHISNRVAAEWTDHNQVGFDLDNFLAIIRRSEPIEGGVGLLNTERMGDSERFERIRGVPGLWHQGTGNADRFGLFINQLSMFFDQVADLVTDRKRRWGNTEPQWYLIEYGTFGTAAYDPRPPKMTITTAALDMVPRVYSIVERAANRILRERGLLS